MLKRTYILRYPRRIIFILVSMLVLFMLAISPIALGIAMMSLEEARTGVTQHEGNNAWGVLPWLGLVTIPIIFPLMLFLGQIISIVLVHDIIFVIREKRSQRHLP